MIVPLTAFQRGEVGGLLDVIEDDLANGDERVVWGRLHYLDLEVLDAKEAVEELRYRAQFLREEGLDSMEDPGAAKARSLEALADKIERWVE